MVTARRPPRHQPPSACPRRPSPRQPGRAPGRRRGEAALPSLEAPSSGAGDGPPGVAWAANSDLSRSRAPPHSLIGGPAPPRPRRPGRPRSPVSGRGGEGWGGGGGSGGRAGAGGEGGAGPARSSQRPPAQVRSSNSNPVPHVGRGCRHCCRSCFYYCYCFVFGDVPGDVLAASESALCGWIGAMLLSLSLSRVLCPVLYSD